ncbi:hypothetical protein EJ02DRAFT_471396 [Clathrospora elynae]|uniref:Uncharacterized protein n=1 Tax=Clathrospora elynae TaxID=706981 RepID=A0A6A5S3D4_9PLEO|nr:hypothetical protein EJ02DRAFT_471396 [Clathrospora elynae]
MPPKDFGEASGSRLQPISERRGMDPGAIPAGVHTDSFLTIVRGGSNKPSCAITGIRQSAMAALVTFASAAFLVLRCKQVSGTQTLSDAGLQEVKTTSLFNKKYRYGLLGMYTRSGVSSSRSIHAPSSRYLIRGAWCVLLFTSKLAPRFCIIRDAVS